MATYRDWRELPFREIWCVDTEYYPGPGKANGGKDGDTITPLCLVAHEMRTGRLIRLWQDELGPFPPYRLDQDAVFISYLLPAEYGFHIARGWGEPARALNAFVEYRHYVNDGALKAEDRDKRFYSLAGALRYFCEDPVDTAHKKEMQRYPVVYFNALVRLAQVLKVEIGSVGAFDQPQTTAEALDRLEQRAGPKARAMLEHFLKRIKEVEERALLEETKQ